MATRKVNGGMMHPGGGGNKPPPPFKFGFLNSGPHNTKGVMNENSNSNSPNTRRKKKQSGASKKRISAKNYRSNKVVFKHKSRANAHVKGRTLKNIQAAWNNNQLVSNMERIGIKKKEKKKGISFKN